MDPAPTCLECGTALAADAPAGHCPRCLLQLGLQTGAVVAEAASPDFPRRLGQYELLDELGRGGMGVVYRARQSRLNRVVALKVILAGPLASPACVRRFQMEAEATAQLDHPQIVPIYEVGECEGQHYFTMKLVEGRSLSERIANRQSPIANGVCAKLLAQVARAVHYAHQHGILHRDLKPSNILIDAAGEPHLTDFGLAKMLSHAGELTLTRDVLGSPNYMAPEQAAGNSRRVTTAADVYSLGAILYKLLTGRAPFLGETPVATLHEALYAEPLAPRRIHPNIPRDLETICLKCLAKEPEQRYSSALAVAEELERFLRDEPILARPASAREKLWRWCRRKPALAGFGAAVVLLVIAVIAASLTAALRIAAARDRERLHREHAEAALTRLEIQRAQDFFAADNAPAALASLARVLRHDPSNRVAAERLLSALTCRSFALPLERTEAGVPDFDAILQRAGWGRLMQTSPDGQWIARASGTAARIYDVRSSEPLTPPLIHSNDVLSVQFSGDGQRVVTAGFDSTARIWDARTGQALTGPLLHSDVVYAATFSPDGQFVATASKDRTARIWDARIGQPVTAPLRHNNKVYSIQFSPDGQRVVTASKDFTARIWNVRTGEPLTEPLRHPLEVRFANFTPDGQRVATVCWDYSRWTWDIGARATRPVVLRHSSEVRGCSFSPDGQRVVTSSSDQTARVWDAQTGQPLGAELRHNSAVLDAEFSLDGSQILTASYEAGGRLWSGTNHLLESRVFPHNQVVEQAHFSRDGTKVVTASWDRTARVWDARTGQPLTPPLEHHGKVTQAHFSPDGAKVVTAGHDAARVWDARTGQAMFVLSHGDRIFAAQFSPDGRRIATGSRNNTARVWDANTGQPLMPAIIHHAEVYALAFSPDGHCLATASGDQTARIWNALNGQPLTEPLPHNGFVFGVQFSPDGRRLLTASWDGTARLWDVATGQALSEPFTHEAGVHKATFSLDGRWIVTASKDATARIWEVPQAPVPIAPWLPVLAEAVGGQRLNAQGLLEDVAGTELARLRQELTTGTPTDEYARWAKWFFADQATKTISPNSPVKMNPSSDPNRVQNSEPKP